jgi:hypothetical protein
MNMQDKDTLPIQSPDEDDLPNISRRSFFKRAALAGAGVMVAGGAVLAASKASLEGSPSKGIETNENFKPKDQRDVVLCYAVSPKLSQYDIQTFEHKLPPDNTREGYDQADRALGHASWFPLIAAKSRPQAFTQPNTPLHSWDQSDVDAEKYEFGSAKRAATMIRSAARLFGAVRCGITRFDMRFVYDPMYDIIHERELYWDKDF